jgi:hypothetical protein
MKKNGLNNSSKNSMILRPSSPLSKSTEARARTDSSNNIHDHNEKSNDSVIVISDDESDPFHCQNNNHDSPVSDEQLSFISRKSSKRSRTFDTTDSNSEEEQIETVEKRRRRPASTSTTPRFSPVTITASGDDEKRTPLVEINEVQSSPAVSSRPRRRAAAAAAIAVARCNPVNFLGESSSSPDVFVVDKRVLRKRKTSEMGTGSAPLIKKRKQTSVSSAAMAISRARVSASTSTEVEADADEKDDKENVEMADDLDDSNHVTDQTTVSSISISRIEKRFNYVEEETISSSVVAEEDDDEEVVFKPSRKSSRETLVSDESKPVENNQEIVVVDLENDKVEDSVLVNTVEATTNESALTYLDIDAVAMYLVEVSGLTFY